ncbi:beta-lactamase/transpeptidase-like protein [Lojkania enalia]|uniref:Beta-lactamase/transpeptidase-like protein n=1 Tax=Lojkania enalia TaxID=147567 RepID=A0A9P4K8W2_9PLEO|nr:beta-lactamase/transpeptidase-like protein [Didymosphaeria enalia]
MADFEKIIEKAVADQVIPGCTVHAINRDGTFKYAKTFGTRSIRPGEDQSPLQFNTIMWIASCTKLMTSICALQLVERGKLSLDEPIYAIIPELRDRQILTGFNEDGTPILTPPTNPITLRLLLSHSSGLTYEAMHPLTMAYVQNYEKRPFSTSGHLLKRFSCPMVFEPGTAWMYGPSIDFAGLMVERVSGMTLEEFMRENLWNPLGIKDMTFSLSKRPDLEKRMADMCKRDPETGKVVPDDAKSVYAFSDDGEDCLGGQGVFSCGEEYIKVLYALLIADEDEMILKRSTVEEMFKPQLSETASAALNAITSNPAFNDALGGTPPDIKDDWGLGGLMLTSDAPDGKRAGTMIWGGYPNLAWFCDRKAGLCGIWAQQTVPPGDKVSAALTRVFEAGMYDMYNKSRDMSPRL